MALESPGFGCLGVWDSECVWDSVASGLDVDKFGARKPSQDHLFSCRLASYAALNHALLSIAVWGCGFESLGCLGSGLQSSGPCNPCRALGHFC